MYSICFYYEVQHPHLCKTEDPVVYDVCHVLNDVYNASPLADTHRELGVLYASGRDYDPTYPARIAAVETELAKVIEVLNPLVALLKDKTVQERWASVASPDPKDV